MDDHDYNLEGRNAYEGGKGVYENPYPYNTYMYREWAEGWYFAEDCDSEWF